MMVPKFRGWDQKNHKMYDFMMMCFGVNLKNVFYRNRLTDFTVNLYSDVNGVNDVEIYEHDIVRVHPGHTDLVLFKSGTFFLDQNKYHPAIPLYDVYGRMKVIGNEYENPDLLGDK